MIDTTKGMMQLVCKWSALCHRSSKPSYDTQVLRCACLVQGWRPSVLSCCGTWPCFHAMVGQSTPAGTTAMQDCLHHARLWPSPHVADLQDRAGEHCSLALDGEAVIDGKQEPGAQLAWLGGHHVQQLGADCVQALGLLLEGLVRVSTSCSMLLETLGRWTGCQQLEQLWLIQGRAMC